MTAARTQLIRQAMAGDPTAFGEVVESYAPLVYSVLLDTVRRREAIDDLAQDTFCQAWRALSTLRRPEGFATWLAQIARHRGLDWLRAEASRTRAEARLRDVVDLEAVGEAGDPVVRHEEHDALWQAMSGLDEATRRLLLLRHVEGCSYRQIAGFLDLPTASVYQRLRRAERQLGREVTRRLRDRPAAEVRRRALRTAVLAALAVPAARADDLTPPGPPAPIHPRRCAGMGATSAAGGLGRSWLDVAWKAAAAGLGLSLLAHLAGLSTPGLLTAGDGDADGSLPLATQVRGVSTARLAATPPSSAPPTVVPHPVALPEPPAAPDPAAAPAVADMAPPAALSADPSRPSAAGDPLLPAPGASPGDLAAADAGATAGEPPVSTASAPGTLWPADAVVRLRPVRLQGAGTYPTLFLADLARFLRDHRGLPARVEGPQRDGFRDPQLLGIPVHFLLQGAGDGTTASDQRLQLAPDELELLRRYLALGGFLYLEGDRFFLRDTVDSLHQIVPDGARLRALPTAHPLFTAAYDLRDGFPGRTDHAEPEIDDTRAWRLPPPGQPLGGIWGIEVDGRLQVLLCETRLFRGWQPDPAIASLDSVAVPHKTPCLQAAANIVAYALEARSP